MGHQTTGVAGALATALLWPAVPAWAQAGAPAPVDYLSFAQGALPVAVGGDAQALRVTLEQALQVIDGDPRGFTLTPRPGGAGQAVTLTFRLPARTTFSQFAIPNVLETPSPSQTFVRQVEITGSDDGPDGPFAPLAAATLSTHARKDDSTRIDAKARQAVRWLRLTLSGGLDVQREQTFFEFSELQGYGEQEAVPMAGHFNGRWSGRGVELGLQQDGPRVTGCYDTDGTLDGTVSGNLLRATGATLSAGIRSSFVLAVGDDGSIVGVRSTNGAPFRLYAGDATDRLRRECPATAPPPLACGAVLHGIRFDADDATIRPDATPLLDQLAGGLKASDARGVTVVGHTSSEGSTAYNEALSQRRAAAVVGALVERGISADRLAADGRGEAEPIADNATEAGRSLNRRVEIACR